MINSIAGINQKSDCAGFTNIVIRPNFIKGLDWACGEYQSVRGLIRSRWQRRGDGISLDIDIPANANAVLLLDGKSIPLKAGKNKINHRTK